MPVTQTAPQELAAISYLVAGTSASTATHGGALSTAWGGTFTIANRTSVEIQLDVPLATLAASTGLFINAHVLVDGVCIGESFLPVYTNGFGARLFIRTRVSPLAVGAHTIAVQIQVSSSTATVTGSAVNPGLLTVKEL